MTRRPAAAALPLLAAIVVATATASGSAGTAPLRLAVHAESPEPFGVYRVDRGGKPVRLTRSRGDEFPAWSPDGKSIVFAGVDGISVIAAAAGPARVLVRGRYDQPAVAPAR